MQRRSLSALAASAAAISMLAAVPATIATAAPAAAQGSSPASSSSAPPSSGASTSTPTTVASTTTTRPIGTTTSGPNSSAPPTTAAAGLAQPPGLLQPPRPPTTPAPSAAARGGTSSKTPAAAGGASRGADKPAGQLLRLLQEEAARRQNLDGQLRDLEGAVDRVEADRVVVADGLRQAESFEASQQAILDATDASRRDLDQVLRPPSARAGSDRKSKPAEAALMGAGVYGPMWALRWYAELNGQVTGQREALVAAQQQTAAARQAMSAASAAVDAQRAALDELRAKLSAALQDAAVMGAGLALTGGAAPSAFAVSDIPAEYLALYPRAAATCPGLPWTVLAAIGSVESSHGRSNDAGVHSGANQAGAMGPMQFLAGTWAAHGADGDGDGTRDVYRPADAVFGAANYLCASGAGDPGRLPDAIWAYNHADWYVDAVLALALRYGSSGLDPAQRADVASLLKSSNLTLSSAARSDLAAGTVDPRVVRLLAAAAATHRIAVSVIRTGHDQFVAGTDRISNHFYGRAVDISSVDGAAVSPANNAAFDLALAILASPPSLRPDELGSPWPGLSQFAGAFSDAAHQNHLHVGFDS